MSVLKKQQKSQTFKAISLKKNFVAQFKSHLLLFSVTYLVLLHVSTWSKG